MNAALALEEISSADDAMLTPRDVDGDVGLAGLSGAVEDDAAVLTWNRPRCVDVPEVDGFERDDAVPGIDRATWPARPRGRAAATSIEEISKVLKHWLVLSQGGGKRDAALERAEPGEDQLEADAGTSLGDQREVRPFVLADLEIESLDDELRRSPWRARRPATIITGTSSSWLVPLIVSLLATWRRPGPMPLMALDWNTARGNFGR